MNRFIVLVFGFMLFLPGLTLAGETTSPYPMFMINAQHTGQSRYAGPALGNIKWSIPNAGFTASGNQIIGADGTIYFVAQQFCDLSTCSSNLFSYDPNGNLKWQYPLPGREGTPAISSRGVIYVANAWDEPNHYLYAISSQGTLLWKTYIGGLL